MKSKLYIPIVILILTNTFCASQTKEITFETKLDSLFSREFSSDEPGGSILFKKRDKIIYLQNYGLANLDTKEKISEHTIFNTGSISKTFVANGILILKERGLLSLDDSLSEFFKDFKNPEIADKINLKHLLSHSSGLPDARNVDDNEEFYLTAKDKENFEPLKSIDGLNFEPGEKFEYSNPVYNGLALIIEKTTNKKWQSFVSEEIFIPSGMTNSKITDGSYPKNDVAHAYEHKEGGYVESDYGETPTFAAAGNGGVWSTVLDLAKYENALKNNSFLDQQTIIESRTIFSPQNWKDPTRPKIGYGWFITPKDKSRFNTDMIYHTGSQGGFNSFYFYFPSKDVLFVGLFNRPLGKSWETMNEALNLLNELHWLDE